MLGKRGRSAGRSVGRAILAFAVAGVVAVFGPPVAAGAEASEPCPGLRVSEVRSGSPAEEAGIRAGDVLRGWRFADRSVAGGLEPEGSVCTFFDHYRLTIELRPRGTVELRWERDGELRPFAPTELSGASLEPAFDGELAELWAAAEPVRSETGSEAAAIWDRLFAAGSRSGVPLSAWLLVDRGYAMATSRSGDPEAGAALMDRARELAAPGHPWIAAHIQRSRGTAFQNRDPASAPWFEAARDGWKAIGEELSAAHATELLGLGELVRFELESARDHLLEVVKVRSRLAPGARFTAMVHSNLSAVYFHLGDRAEAVSQLERSLEILDAYPPDRLRANALVNLAGISGMLGDTEKEVAAGQEALDLVRELDLGGSTEVSAIITLAGSYVSRGDLAAAEALAREAIAPASALRDTERLAQVHQLIGSIAEQRGDLEVAEVNYRRAIEVHEGSESPSPELAMAAIGLAQALTVGGELAEAEPWLERASSYLAEHAPEHYSVVALGAIWAELLLESGRPDQALAKADEAIAAALAVSTGGDYLLPARIARGRALIDLDRVVDAAAEAGEVLSLARGYAPGTLAEVRAQGLLGRVEARRGRWQPAADAFCLGADLLERQIERLGGVVDSASRFRSRYLDLFEGCAEARIELGETDAAFEVIERSRAWTARRALAERGLLLGAHSADLTARFRRLAIEHDEVLAEWAGAGTEGESPGVGEDEGARFRARLSELALERETLLAEARAADPRLAAVAYPTPLTARQAARHLHEGELLVVYEVVADATLAIAVSRDRPPSGLRLTDGEAELRSAVGEFLAAIAERRDDPELRRQAEGLWRRLVEPVLGPERLPERLIVSADGPLLRLPWAALGFHRADGGWRWSVEELSVVVVPSATVSAGLAERAATRATRVVAFGDPALAGGSEGEVAELRSLLDLRGPLQALPGSRTEAEALVGIFDAVPVDLFLGPEASEANARTLDRGHRVVHFASHALVDEVHPLESGLVLATPSDARAGVDNGFLQAWEIIDHLRLDADLVTLSACSTARGTELRGEGTLDLASAFLHAGARSVVASLWPVSDRSTAVLMDAFYREIAAGAPRDEALRKAQLALLGSAAVEASPDSRERGVGGLAPAPEDSTPVATSAPFYWAPFRLSGRPD